MAEWLGTVVTSENGCPRCQAAPGQDCRMPSGRKTSSAHVERFRTATKAQRDRCTGGRAQPMTLVMSNLALRPPGCL